MAESLSPNLTVGEKRKIISKYTREK